MDQNQMALRPSRCRLTRAVHQWEVSEQLGPSGSWIPALFVHYQAYWRHLVLQNNHGKVHTVQRLVCPWSPDLGIDRRFEPVPESRFVVATIRKIKIKDVFIIYRRNRNWLKYGFLEGTGRHSQHVPLLFPKPPGGQISVKLLRKHFVASRSMQSYNSWLKPALKPLSWWSLLDCSLLASQLKGSKVNEKSERLIIQKGWGPENKKWMQFDRTRFIIEDRSFSSHSIYNASQKIV